MAAFLFLCLAVGCAHHIPPAPTTRAVLDHEFVREYVPSVQLNAVIPLGWHPDPLKKSPQHTHQVWLSPSGHTAYGIIHFTLPLPVGHEMALLGFLKNMKRTEGEATLLSKTWDPNLYAMRFVVVGGLYMVRVNLFVRGTEGWAIYAGTLRKEKIEPKELALAERARELTKVEK